MKQSDLSNPVALAKIIAASNSNNIPVNATGSSYASQTEGFPEITMIPEEQGGEAPHGKDFNGFLRILTSHMFNIQNGTPETFNPEVSNLIGGYPKNAQLWLINGTTSRLLKSTKDDNTDNFLTTPSVIGTSWIDAFPTKDYVDGKDTNLQSQITTNANNIAIKANNNAVVHLTGDETITGAKTFSGNLIKTMGTSANGVKVQCVDLVKGTPPTSQQGNVYGQFTFQDNGGTDLEHRFGGIEVAYKPDGTITAQLEACQPVANSTTYERIAVIYPASGSAYTYAPAPSLASNVSGYANQIVTVGYLEGSSAGIAHTTGNEIIGGNKTFTGTSTFTGDAVYNSRFQMLYDTAGTNSVFIQNTAITKGTTPTSATESATRIVFNGAGGSTVNYRIGSFETGYYDDGSIQTFMRAYKPTANNNTNAVLGLVYPASGNPYGTAPASDVNGSIVTTVNKSKAADGYFKLGNGMIVQWGKTANLTNNASSPTSTTFPTAFTSTNYRVMLTVEANSGNNEYALTVLSKTTTSFSAILRSFEGGAPNKPAAYIAIGY